MVLWIKKREIDTPKKIGKRCKYPLFQKLTDAYFLGSFFAEGSKIGLW